MERYKLGDIDNERFYMLPKGLFMGKYSTLKLTSKVIYAFLKDKMKLSQKNGWIERNGDVYLMANQDYVADKLNLSTKTVTRGFKELKDVGLIECARQGLSLPNKIYIKRIETNLDIRMSMSNQEGTKRPNRGDNLTDSEGTKRPTNDTDKNDTEINDTKRYTETRTQGTHNFQKPTVEEIQEYCSERENDVDPEAFFDFYESKGWKVGRNPMKDWKAAVRNWERNDYGQHKKKKKKKSQYDEIDF